MMPDPVQVLINRLAELGSTSENGSTTDRLGQIIVRQEAIRLVHRLNTVASGAFVTRDPMDIAALVESVAATGRSVPCRITVSDRLLHKLSEPVRAETLSLLFGLLDSDETPIQGGVQILASSYLNAAQDSKLLRVLARAVARGLSVELVVPDDGDRAAVSLAISDDSDGVQVEAHLADGTGGAAWVVELRSRDQSPSATVTAPEPSTFRKTVPFSLPATSVRNGAGSASIDAKSDKSPIASITDLFGDLISLRDLEPRSPKVRGLGELRQELGLAAPFVPRKSDPEYARVVASFAQDVAGPHPTIIYVGDTVFNDGTAICGLEESSPGSVYGFLCNERGFGIPDDFTVGPIYFAKKWRSVNRFVEDALHHGLSIDKGTVGFFDLDQTVYAAKGRDDEPLRIARWKALLAFLKDSIPPHRFDPAQAERIYRHLDQDSYHRITRDNMDYVALFVLAVSAGLCDAPEIEEFAASPENSIASLTERLYQRARARKGHEEIDGVIDEIRRVYLNTLNGDQTPCKGFRRYECEETAVAMRGAANIDVGARITLNHEVVDLVVFLRDRGVHVFALSDRPIEAAVVETDDGAAEDLMSIPMPATGMSTYASLVEVAG